jgi:hypothetical protein
MKGSQVRQVVQHPTGALKLWYFFVANMPSGATRRSIERCGGSNNLREVVVCDDEDDRDYPDERHWAAYGTQIRSNQRP